MNYSYRYMDVKNRPMLQIRRNTNVLDVTVKLFKIACYTALIYIAFISLAFFIQNLTYWGR